MKVFVMVVNIDHMYKVNEPIYMPHDFINYARREVHTIVFVAQNVSQNSDKNKKNSNCHQVMMDTVVIFHMRRLVKE